MTTSKKILKSKDVEVIEIVLTYAHKTEKSGCLAKL